MGSIRRRALVPALVVCVGLLVVTPRAKEPECEFTGVERVVAVGDVHGAYDQLVPVLQNAGIVDQRLRWSAGKTHFVQVGDVLDRGPDSRKVLDLYMRLEREASSAGGRFHYLLGNHEAMRLTGDYRYLNAGEYGAFLSPKSAEVRRDYVETIHDPELSATLAKEPLGMIELMFAFGSNGKYGSFLRRLNTVVHINDVVFVHGGISPMMGARGCGDINAAVRKELTVDLNKTRSAPNVSLAFGPDGPLWYRGLALESDAFAPQVDEILKAQRAKAIVVGHTAQVFGRIFVRFGGRVVVIDTGMQPQHVPTGRASALELRGGVFTAIYADSREVVSDLSATTAAVP